MTKASEESEDVSWLDGDAPEQPAVPTRGQVVSKVAISQWTGLAPVTIDRCIADGAPVISKGTRREGYQINSAQFFDWYWRKRLMDATGNPDVQSYDAAKKREKSATAELKEIQIAERQARLLEIEEVQAIWDRVFGDIRSQIVSLSSQVPSLGTEQRTQLEEAINDLLRDLSEKQESNAFTAAEDQESEA